MLFTLRHFLNGRRCIQQWLLRYLFVRYIALYRCRWRLRFVLRLRLWLLPLLGVGLWLWRRFNVLMRRLRRRHVCMMNLRGELLLRRLRRWMRASWLALGVARRNGGPAVLIHIRGYRRVRLSGWVVRVLRMLLRW